MLCLICWLDGQTKWVLDPAYHEHVTGHAPDLANDEIADALLDGRLVLTLAPGLPYPQRQLRQFARVSSLCGTSSRTAMASTYGPAEVHG
jgi:hypothetical protein